MTEPTVLPPAWASSANDLWDLELPAEIEAANRLTHDYWDARCAGCDCRPGGAWSRFACVRWSAVGGNTEALTWEAWNTREEVTANDPRT